MKILLIIFGIICISVSGCFGVLTGALLADMQSPIVTVSITLVISTLLALVILKSIFKLRLVKLLPFLSFTATCIFCGFAYDRILIPEGFKLIILMVLLIMSGLLASKSINASKNLNRAKDENLKISNR